MRELYLAQALAIAAALLLLAAFARLLWLECADLRARKARAERP